jgi:hypothetical protein
MASIIASLFSNKTLPPNPNPFFLNPRALGLFLPSLAQRGGGERERSQQNLIAREEKREGATATQAGGEASISSVT